LELLREKEMTDVKVVVGGIIPDEDARELLAQGVTAVFQPGASLDAIVASVRQAAAAGWNRPGEGKSGEDTPAQTAPGQKT
jgi:methylmalonyl-CoA mutase C-terminal domain/subunit